MPFSWHTPQNLYAEGAMALTALLVIAYRFMGGKNEWLKTHGVILITYYAVGGVLYDELEGWPLLDSTYFLTVTITTVGYGDICPETPGGKMFTVVYALVGIIFVFAALSPLVDMLMIVKDFLLKPCAPEEDDGATTNLEVLRANGNWGFKYGVALAGPGIIFVLGLLIGFFVMNLDLIDGIYWSMITMTTIGYGDISGSTWYEKAVLCLYLPTAVAALADALAVTQSIGTAKMLIETDFAKQADSLLLGEAGGPEPNPDETLTEAEFLISVLVDNGIVDDMTVHAIRLQFAHITRHDTSKSDNKVLNDKIVFLEMRSQGRIQQSAPGAKAKAADGTTIDLVDLKAEDGGFGEWLERCWWPRVFDGKPVGPQVRLQPVGVAAAPEAAAPGGKKGAAGGKAPASGYNRLVDEGASHRSPRLLPQREEGGKPGGYWIEGQMAVADGEYVWVARERKGGGMCAKLCDDKDLGLWLALGVFAIYFCLKAVPVIWSHHMGAAPSPLLSLDEGDTVSAEMLAEIQALVSRRR